MGEAETEVFLRILIYIYCDIRLETTGKRQRNAAVFQDLRVEIQEEGPPEAAVNIRHGIMEKS